MKRVLALLCCCVGIAGCGPAAWAAPGDLLAKFSFQGAGFAVDAARHRMLITDYTNNKLVAFDTRTLQQVASVVVGSRPVGVALSSDGNCIYVANSNALSISVLDASSLTLASSITTPYKPSGVAAGLRLYATPGSASGYEEIMQFNTETGQLLGGFSGGPSIYYNGMLQISPDNNTLYFANVGLSPGTLAKYDVSTDTPALLWRNEHGALGSNGQDLTLSHAGDAIYYSVGSGNTGYGYSIAKIRTSDMTSLGALNTGAYPTALALSPDDKLAYTINATGYIDIFDTSTFAKVGRITTTSSDDYYGADLMVDDSGTRLFVAYPNSYYNTPSVCVYDTGERPNVTPPTGVSVAISSPTTGPTYVTNAATVDLAGIANETDSSGNSLGWGYLNTISWSSNRGGTGSGTFANSATSPSTWSIQSVPLQGGDNVITVTATDVWGNNATAVIAVSWVPGSVGAAKKQAAGTKVYVSKAVVTATGIAAGSAWVESSDRSSGIRLVTGQVLNVGDEISFNGTVSRVNGEYQISGVSVLITTSTSPLAPVFLTSKGICNDRTESLNYIGLDATGLLARTAGRVAGTVSTQRLFYIDDGAQYQDGVGPVSGLRVHAPGGYALPRTGKCVSVTGILRVEKFTLTGWGLVNGDWYPSGTILYVPSIWARNENDIQVLP